VSATLDIKLNRARPLTDAAPLVRAEGKAISAGRQLATDQQQVIGADGKLPARAFTPCLISSSRWSFLASLVAQPDAPPACGGRELGRVRQLDQQFAQHRALGR
jgi:hypothetical protein